jgi:hypothetical protein
MAPMQDARYSSTVSGKPGVEAHRNRALEMLSMRPIVDPVAGDLFQFANEPKPLKPLRKKLVE